MFSMYRVGLPAAIPHISAKHQPQKPLHPTAQRRHDPPLRLPPLAPPHPPSLPPSRSSSLSTTRPLLHRRCPPHADRRTTPPSQPTHVYILDSSPANRSIAHTVRVHSETLAAHAALYLIFLYSASVEDAAAKPTFDRATRGATRFPAPDPTRSDQRPGCAIVPDCPF